KYSADDKKDQTYMLWRLPQDILSMLVFPLSNMKKEEIRRDSKEKGLFAAERGDSQEICFIPDGDYVSYIENRAGASARGNFIDEEGNVLGEHKGIINYTVGQRKGLGISAATRIFVTDINPKNNTVTLSKKSRESTALTVSGVIYSGMNELKLGDEKELSVKLRYAAPAVKCRVICTGENELSVILDAPVRAVTAGQSAVFYEDGVLLLGGFIDAPHS
ncbi:MAG: tRNA 2-thiouridine(34) synthase MnmA, partial [Clostridia bacterium]|nr:tRNA 2-thiouridine(34) synthase MnmA [Clostridia bacterium]